MHPSLSSSVRQTQSLTPIEMTVYHVDTLSVFEARGLDTLTFLQGQLTNDIVAPGTDQSCLAGYCTAQGRLLATMVLGENPNTDGVPVVRGLIRTDILAPVLKRLGMFVLRAKVALTVTDLGVVGVTAPVDRCAALASKLNHPLPELPWQTVHAETGTWIAAPSVDPLLRRWWWIAGSQHQAICESIGVCWGYGQASVWEGVDIQAGLPWIQARTQDLFIPQTLNLDLIGGVSFTKGCYPGQEIVARSHYRGTVKKRMALGKVKSMVHPPGAVDFKPGEDIFDGTQPDQPCGRLINVAAITVDEAVEQWLLFETTFDAYDHQQLKIGSASGPAIQAVPLPYSTRPETK